MGASANPIQNMVMDRFATTTLMFHLSASIDPAGLTSPADKPASIVTAHDIQVIIFLRHFGHLNGDVYFSSLGASGGGD